MGHPAVVIPTVGIAVAGSEIGPEGTLAGEGLGFGLGLGAAPFAFDDEFFVGGAYGLAHGAIACVNP